MKGFCVPNDQLDVSRLRISICVEGQGFSPADSKPPLNRLQPLKLSLIAALLCLLLVTAGAAPLLAGAPARTQESGAGTAPAGNAQNGKKYFTSDGCFECHGYQGQGATQTGAARIGPPLLTLESFMSYVRHPTGQMPPYTGKALSDQDLTDIFAYLKSIPLPPKGKDIPLLNK